MAELRIDEARVNRLDDVMAFVDGILESCDCPMRAQMQIDVAVEEIYVNIASYAYEPDVGPAVIRMEVDPQSREASIEFTDWGMPYDPTAKPDPDVTLSAAERQIGGLGIYMVKQSMDSMEYTRADGRNLLTIRKQLP